jgi:Ca-activated chloride channel family protein
MIEQFHFLRPGWLLLLLPLAAWLWGLFRGRYDHGIWRTVVDERLMPHVLSGSGGARGHVARAMPGAAAALAIIALAGPTWEKLPQPVFQTETALVIMLDLSRSMDAADIKPSRLVRARHKIADILSLRAEGQTALVVYAADAFAVTPLTSDTETIMAMLPDLDSSLMPAQGSRADRAVERALELFENAAHQRGDLLLISDGIGDTELQRIEALLSRHADFRLSVLAVGTADGGPIPLASGGFLKTGDGAIVISPMQEGNLRRLADHGGVYATLSSDDIDINTLAYVFEASIDSSAARLDENRSAEVWRELGPWLLLAALPLAALAFRRGLFWLLPLWLAVVPPDADALDWQALWQNPDQRANGLFEREDFAAAAEIFDDPAWKAAAQYRAGDYAGALDNWSVVDGDDALYNRANALARLQRYDDALAAYDALLERNPEHQDALFNRRAIEEFLRNRQQQQQQSGEGGQQQQSQDSQQQQSQDGQQQQSQGGQQQQSQGGQQQQGEGEPQDEGEPQQQQQQQQSGEGGEPRQSQDGQQQGEGEPGDEGERQGERERVDEQMSAQAAEQWLRKIPDDPGGLLRRKFLYQYRERGTVDDEAESW